jgi:hypothetical protein
VKTVLALSGLAALLAAIAAPAAEMRTWNLKSGATMEGELVGFPSDDKVSVKRSDGKVYTLSETYLADADRVYLETQRAKQWKEVSVDKLLGTVSSGRYKKCAVSGKEVSGQILVMLLPAQVEAILTSRKRQEAQIADLNSRIQTDSNVARNATAAAKGGNRAYRNANKAEARVANRDEFDAKTSLDQAKTNYTDYVKKTKATTMVLMRNTGTTYEGLAVWECQAPTKRQ